MRKRKLLLKQIISLSMVTSLFFGLSPGIKAHAKETDWIFKFTGNEQKFIVPYDGVYNFDLYGASGGSSGGVRGGYGGYSYGEKTLKKGDVLYVNVGGQGKGIAGGWNGGGNGGRDPSGAHGTGGGGASDIRLNDNELANRIIVAGGGGGLDNGLERGDVGGNGGGVKGGDGRVSEEASKDEVRWGKQIPGKGGTQTSGGAGASSGSLGQGGNATSNTDFGGGGGGYFGGGASDSVGVNVTKTITREIEKVIQVPVERTEVVPGLPYVRLYKRGDSDRGGSNHIKLIQEKVGTTPDGVFGANTERKVKEWQRRYNLVDDGQVGRITWKTMFPDTTRVVIDYEERTVLETVTETITESVKFGSSSAGGGSGYVGKVNNGITIQDEHVGDGIIYITFQTDFKDSPDTQPGVPPVITPPPTTPDDKEPILGENNLPKPWTGPIQGDNSSGGESYIDKPYNPYNGIPVVKTSNTWKRTYDVYSWKGTNVKYKTADGKERSFVKYVSGSKETKTLDQNEAYSITSILFKSKYTTDTKQGANRDGWVELTKAGAMGAIKAGYGYELKITVNYNSNAYSQPEPSLSGSNKENGTSVRPYNASPNLPNEIFIKTPDGKILSLSGYKSTVVGLDNISSKGNKTNMTRTYQIKPKDTLGIKSTPKLYIDENTKDGIYDLEVFTPVINGVPNKPTPSQLGDKKIVKVKVNGSYLDDLNTHLIQ